MSTLHSFSLKALCASAVMMTLLTGCEDGKFNFPGRKSDPDTPGAPEQSQSVQLVERDVEAPEVFQKSDKGLWDGRPSLGGVWAAHESVKEPERVIIRNQDNGKFVIGALFRKEASLPGPKFQISSDAAQTLGMLAGAPAQLSVTALRREETAPADAPAPAADPAGSPAAPVTTKPIDAPKPDAPKPTQTSPLTKPYVQLGIFSVKANAERTARQMTTAGLTAKVAQSSLSGKTFYRVLVGPAQTASQRAQLLGKVKAQGFSDAYFVKN